MRRALSLSFVLLGAVQLAPSCTPARTRNVEQRPQLTEPVAVAPAPAPPARDAPAPSPFPELDSGTGAPEPDAAPEAPEVVEPSTPPELTTDHARGTCVSRRTLRTKSGDVDCYPYRCRTGRCLLSCKARTDCAGSDGPADLAENGWPLDCNNSGDCYPLSPRHVHP